MDEWLSPVRTLLNEAEAVVVGAGFYPFSTQEEKWAYWSRHIYYNRYGVSIGKPYLDLYQPVKDRNYFILTTNVDHQFQLAGFPEERIFAVQGDYGLFQCARA